MACTSKMQGGPDWLPLLTITKLLKFMKQIVNAEETHDGPNYVD